MASNTAQPDWSKVERLVGLPDYGVMFCVSPWPDGGWMAGVVVIDLEWVVEQIESHAGITCVMGDLPEDSTYPSWDIIDGFHSGVTVHGYDAADAIDILWQTLHGQDGDHLDNHAGIGAA